jgi:hypothetical protein
MELNECLVWEFHTPSWTWKKLASSPNGLFIMSDHAKDNYSDHFSLGNTISLCITYQILITPLVSSNSSYPIIIDVMSYKGQKDYKSCKVQSHTTTTLPIYYRHDIISRIHNRNNNTHLSIIRMGIVCSGPINQ